MSTSNRHVLPGFQSSLSFTLVYLGLLVLVPLTACFSKAFTLSWNEFIYALAFIQSSEKKTVPVAILTELVTGDVYQWGALMAGSLLGSLPVAIFYSLFVDY